MPSNSQELSLHEGMDFLTPQWQTGSTGSGRPGGSTRPSSSSPSSSSTTPGVAPPAGGGSPTGTPPPSGGRGSGNGSSSGSGPVAPFSPTEPLFPPAPTTPMSPPATVDLGGPDAPVTTTPVRIGRYLYVLDKSPNLPYRDAVASCRCAAVSGVRAGVATGYSNTMVADRLLLHSACPPLDPYSFPTSLLVHPRSRTLLSLSWQMIDLTDAVAFESSLLVRATLLELLSSRERTGARAGAEAQGWHRPAMQGGNRRAQRDRVRWYLTGRGNLG